MTKIKYFTIILLYFLFFESNGISQENYLSEGKKLFDNQKYLESKFKFEQDIVFNPKSEESYLYLAKIFSNEENDELEEQNLNTVILLNPKNEEAIFNLTLVNLKKSDFNGAKKLINDFEKNCKNLCSQLKTLKTKLENSLKK